MNIFLKAFNVLCTFLIIFQLFLVVLPINNAMADSDIPAVIKPDNICTMDINSCGNSSICACPDGYDYNSSVGACLIDDVFEATSPGDQNIESKCALKPQSFCTRDMNPAGNPSICGCPDGTDYNDVLGKCLKPVN